MTARDIYEGTLIDLNKVHAPALSVEEFNYLLNKVILAYVNERYNLYSVNQQLDDDLRVLLTEATIASETFTVVDTLDPTYISLQFTDTNYLHMLSCDMTVRNTISNRLKRYTAKRLSVDMLASIMMNEYLKPAVTRPYYMVGASADVADRNSPTVTVYIGQLPANVVAHTLRFFYLKLPAVVTLTDAQVYTLETDTSPVLQFPDYLKNEFVKRIVLAQLDETGDQRIANFAQLNQEIPTIPLELSGGDAYTQTSLNSNTNSNNN